MSVRLVLKIDLVLVFGPLLIMGYLAMLVTLVTVRLLCFPDSAPSLNSLAHVFHVLPESHA